MQWHQQAAQVLDEMDAETSGHERRKAFYASDGVARAKQMIAELDALRDCRERGSNYRSNQTMNGLMAPQS